jgi:hypothetical protein
MWFSEVDKHMCACNGNKTELFRQSVSFFCFIRIGIPEHICSFVRAARIKQGWKQQKSRGARKANVLAMIGYIYGS